MFDGETRRIWPTCKVGHVGFSEPEVVIRDRRTLEIRQFYPLPESAKQQSSFSLDVYFFFPRNFGFDQHPWEEKQFYRDARLLLRLHAPSLSLEDLSSLCNSKNPLCLLRKRMARLLEPEPPLGVAMVALARMYGAELADVIRHEGRSIRRWLKQTSKRHDKESGLDRVSQLCVGSLTALRALRRVEAKAQAFRGVLHPDLLPSLAFAEEYVSNVLDDTLSSLVLAADESRGMHDDRGSATKLRVMIAGATEKLTRWRMQRGYMNIQNNDWHEAYSYRIELIKRELQRALYIDTRALARDNFVTNSAAMVAAGLAATWATLANIPLLQGAVNAGSNTKFVVAAVGAYVLKDRIKDWTKNSLAKLLHPWDHDRRILGGALASVGLGKFSGRVRERMRHLQEVVVPQHVRDMRDRQRTVYGSHRENEDVLHYRREQVFEIEGKSPLPREYGVQEVFRVSFDDILKRLEDAPEDVAFYVPRRGRFRRETLSKVYHVNMVTLATDLNTGEQFAIRTRVVFNRAGAVRLVPVLSRREHVSVGKRPRA